MKKNFKLLLFFSLPFCFFSCDSDCKPEEIEKAEWTTHYEDYKVDTLANYRVVRDYIHFNESYSAEIDELYGNIKLVENEPTLKSFLLLRTMLNKKISGINNITREIEIRNNSDFPARFAIGDTNNFFREGVNTYQTIQPRSIATFYLSRSIHWNSYNNSNFNSEITISQIEQKIDRTRRIDELKTEMIIVNNCEQSVPALKREYKTVKDLYYSKVDAEGKKVIQDVKSKNDKIIEEKRQKSKSIN